MTTAEVKVALSGGGGGGAGTTFPVGDGGSAASSSDSESSASDEPTVDGLLPGGDSGLLGPSSSAPAAGASCRRTYRGNTLTGDGLRS